MSALLELYFNQVVVFVLILTRITALVMTAPIFGSRSIPVRVRALLAVALAMLVTPVYWNIEVEDPGNLVNFVVLLGGEVVVGLALGLGVRILFSGVQVAGSIIGQMSGTRLADVVDPSFNENVAVYGQLMDMTTLAVFVAIGGHRQVMDALLATFRRLPPGTGGLPADLVATMTELITQSFILAIRAAAPAIVALLLSMLIMGLISRTLPQLNILVVGFSFNSLITMAVVALSLGMVAWIFQDEVAPTLVKLRELFLAAAL